jgi:flagellar hook-length control protein FliK
MPIATRYSSPLRTPPSLATRPPTSSSDDTQRFSDLLSTAQSTQTDSRADDASSSTASDTSAKSDRAPSKRNNGKSTHTDHDSESSSTDTSTSATCSDPSTSSTKTHDSKTDDTSTTDKPQSEKSKSDDADDSPSPDAAAVQAAVTAVAQAPATPAQTVKLKPSAPAAGTGIPPQTITAATPDGPKPPAAKSAKASADKSAATAPPTSPAALDEKPATSDTAAQNTPPTAVAPKSAFESVKAPAKPVASTSADTGAAAASPSSPASPSPDAAAPAVTTVQTAEVAATLVKASIPTDSAPHTDNSTPAPLTATATIAAKTNTPDRATTASAAQEPPVSDGAQTFDQVVLGLRGKIDARNGKAEIRLDPPNLGTVHVSISLDKGTLTAQFQSDSDSVRDLLKGNMEKLKTVLESQGVAVDRLSVESPATKAAAPDASSAQAGANNGRSAGQYHQNASDQRRSQKESSTFSRVWREATQDAAPMDVTA